MADTADLDGACRALVDAAVDPTRWGEALDAVSAATGSFGGALIPYGGHGPGIPHSESLDGLFHSYVEEGWVDRDERYRGLPQMKAGGIACELDYASEDEMRHSAYWDWLGKFGLRWHSAMLFNFGGEPWFLAVQRTIVQGPMPVHETRVLKRLAPHLAAAGTLAKAFGFARLEAAGAAFEASQTAVLFIDRQLRVIRCNARAQSLLGEDLQITKGKLASFDPQATQALERAMASMRDTVIAEATALVVLPRREKRPVMARLSKATRLFNDRLGTCQVVVTLFDPEARAEHDRALLRAGFGLTPVEARLAICLASGRPLRACANELRISYENGRQRAKVIYSKLGVAGHAELVALIHALGKNAPGT